MARRRIQAACEHSFGCRHDSEHVLPHPYDKGGLVSAAVGLPPQNVEQLAEDLDRYDEGCGGYRCDDRPCLLSLRFVAGMQALGINDGVGVERC
jgi:hypothetical protein